MTSYSIKEIEKLYGFVRTASVAGGDESVVLFKQDTSATLEPLTRDRHIRLACLYEVKTGSLLVPFERAGMQCPARAPAPRRNLLSGVRALGQPVA